MVGRTGQLTVLVESESGLAHTGRSVASRYAFLVALAFTVSQTWIDAFLRARLTPLGVGTLVVVAAK